MKAAILAIGTELTTGQITNKNASHLSALLKDLGIQTLMHLTVPDDRGLILEALESTSKKCDLIITTGGLGPTSDDFTRDVVTQWLQSSLVFDRNSWDMLSERLISRGYTVKEIQRQQCYFPVGSHILKNSEGTANGFYARKNQTHLFVLPGPPREINAIWKDGMKDILTPMTSHLDPIITLAWDTLGVGESDVAMMVNEVLAMHNFTNELSGIDIGYRVHLPYVEVKVSFLKSQQDRYQRFSEELDKKLAAITITRNGADILLDLVQVLAPHPEIHILDEVSGTFLLNRMLPALKKSASAAKVSWANHMQPSLQPGLILKLTQDGPLKAKISCQLQDKELRIVISSPYDKVLMQERRQQYFAEMALVHWHQFLKGLPEN